MDLQHQRSFFRAVVFRERIRNVRGRIAYIKPGNVGKFHGFTGAYKHGNADTSNKHGHSGATNKYNHQHFNAGKYKYFYADIYADMDIYGNANADAGFTNRYFYPYNF